MKRKQKQPIVENPDFVALMQVALQDGWVRQRLLTILTLDRFNRESALNTFAEQMQLRGAPRKFTEAIASFLDDAIAEKTLSILDNG